MSENSCSAELLNKAAVASPECINEELVSKNDDGALELSEIAPRDNMETSKKKSRNHSLSPSYASSSPRADRNGRNSLLSSSPKALVTDSSIVHWTSNTDITSLSTNVCPRKKKKRRKSSAHQELLLNVDLLHHLSEVQSQDTVSITSSMQSIITCPPGDLIRSGKNCDSTVPSPSLYVTYSPNLSEWSSKEDNNTNISESSSLYHSSCLYPPTNGKTSSRPCTPRNGRRMSSPAVCTIRRQPSQELARIHPSNNKLSHRRSRRYSTQDIATISSRRPTSPSSLRPHSLKDDSSAGSSTPRLHRGSNIPDNVPYLPSEKFVPCRKVRGSIDGNAMLEDPRAKYLCHQQGKESKELADQNCRSQFGEVTIAEANNVLKFAPLKTNKTGISGTLFVTNFKVSFVTSLPVDTKERDLHERSLQNHYLDVHDVCLSEVDTLNQFSEENTKKKRPLYNSNLPPRLSGLQLVLKNLRIINFSFKFTPALEALKVAKALLHHAFPPSIDHLFLSTTVPPPSPGIPDFQLPSVLVVPRDLLDAQLEASAQHFQGTRPPVWCWGAMPGAALVRMAQISPGITDKQQENRMMGLVHRCHPKKLEPTILDLDQILPSLKDIQISYLKLKELHTPDDPGQFWDQDRHYYSRWESSRWLTYVSRCLEVAQMAATAIYHHNSSVILQDNEGRDLSAVISSLVQLLLDPQVRTIRGFHCLVQKEWVALGHPFTNRLGHTRNNPEEQCPLWLLFLDCVYQVSEQHHAALEFTSQYLVALWHASHCSLHSSFTFNSINAKYNTTAVLQRENPHQPVYLKPVWTWWAESPIVKDSECNGSPADFSKRKSSKEAFLNVYYIQSLLESLSANGAMKRITDPLSSAYHTWQRIEHLLGDDGTLPFDPLAPTTPLQLDALRVEFKLSGLKPWRDCFCAWLSEPVTLTINDSDSLLKPLPSTSHHWKHIYHIYKIIKEHLAKSLTNGTIR
ncbi:hypothetical protein Pmani_019991 [Petrolisthes manimaculis]|uniref:Myotubularin phosphatase domain-containing protein n=1 Tax=Petrolisthes manimaculis TaxID=1843537 RepID=A0AAE1PGL4_9EUCA|nr:hypothetical protein Pmani_019991 [Petrolisthes manimaculis]